MAYVWYLEWESKALTKEQSARVDPESTDYELLENMKCVKVRDYKDGVAKARKLVAKDGDALGGVTVEHSLVDYRGVLASDDEGGAVFIERWYLDDPDGLPERLED